MMGNSRWQTWTLLCRFKVRTQFYTLPSCSDRLKGQHRHITKHISIFLHCMAKTHNIRSFTGISPVFYPDDALSSRLYKPLSWWLRLKQQKEWWHSWGFSMIFILCLWCLFELFSEGCFILNRKKKKHILKDKYIRKGSMCKILLSKQMK